MTLMSSDEAVEDGTCNGARLGPQTFVLIVMKQITWIL